MTHRWEDERHSNQVNIGPGKCEDRQVGKVGGRRRQVLISGVTKGKVRLGDR